MEQKSICIIGRGNVGTHLARAFSEAGHRVRLIGARFLKKELQAETAFHHNADLLSGEYLDADFIILAVRDEAVVPMAKQLAPLLKLLKPTAVVAHTSGSVPLEALSEGLRQTCASTGVFYPMQTFKQDTPMHYASIPFLIEASTEEAETELRHLALTVSPNVVHADSATRRDYHIGAVFACNFSNYLFTVAQDYLESRGLDFNTLLPLLQQTTAKLSAASPRMSQTGPAKRGDKAVVESHISQLANNPEARDLYALLSDKIMNYPYPGASKP